MTKKDHSRSERMFRALLRLFPFDFRWKHGQEMEQVFREQQREEERQGGKMSTLKLWWATLADIARTAPREHLEMLAQDAGYALRLMRKNLGFTTVAVLTLALGIGANTAIFSLVDAILLRPLPVRDHQRLVTVFHRSRGSSGYYSSASYPDYLDFRDKTKVFSGIMAYSTFPVHLSYGGVTERVEGQIVSGNYFSVLGVKAAPGRTFLPEEDQSPGANPVAVISHSLWKRRFGGDPEVMRKSVILNGYSFAVVGVAPPGFKGTALESLPDVWVPLMMHAQVHPLSRLFRNRGTHWLTIMGRLKRGITLDQAQAAMSMLAGQLERTYPEIKKGWGINLIPATEAKIWPGNRGSLLRFMGLLMGVVGIVLLIACANVANLLLSRATDRGREIAVRLALGASRLRLLRQLMTESVLLSVLAATAGVLLAAWVAEFLSRYPLPSVAPNSLRLQIDNRVLGFTVLVSLLATVLFGLAPAIRAARTDLVAALKGLGVARGPRKSRGRQALVVAQVALSLVLLVAAGLFMRSMQTALATDTGFSGKNLLQLTLDLKLQGYGVGQGRAFYGELLERVSGLPGVHSTSLARLVPLSGFRLARDVVIEGFESESQPAVNVDYNVVSSRYFETLGIPLLQGRDFTPRDGPGAPGVVIVSQTMARRFWPGQNPLGQRIRLKNRTVHLEVIAVAKDTKYRTWSESPRTVMYLPLSQNYQGGMTLHMKFTSKPDTLLAAVRHQVQALDKNLPVFNVKSMEGHLRASLWLPRMGAELLSLFGLLALALAAVGIYGVISYSVSQRTHEIGIRMALGAQRRDILKLVVGHGIVLTLMGVGVGLAGAFALTRFLESLLFGVTPTDPATFAGVAFLLAAVALLACYIPARRATKVDPIVALRYE